jgi:hypothetical protein
MRAKRLVFSWIEAGCWVAKSPVGEWVVFRASERGKYRINRFPAQGTVLPLGGVFNKNEEAREACQAEFDRIWREMTDTGEAT